MPLCRDESIAKKNLVVVQTHTNINSVMCNFSCLPNFSMYPSLGFEPKTANTVQWVNLVLPFNLASCNQVFPMQKMTTLC